MKAVAAIKKYPSDYPQDAVRVLEAMSINDDLILIGSMSIRSQQYAGDYDAYEVVKLETPNKSAALAKAAGSLQTMVKEVGRLPNTYISETKIGAIPEWDILDGVEWKDDHIVGYNQKALHAKIEGLRSDQVISPSEAAKSKALLKPKMSFQDYQNAEQHIKFHILRWTVPEILAGRKRLRNGHVVSLQSAINSPGLVKVDVISLVSNNRFTDFSIIYDFRWRNEVLNPMVIDVPKSLKESFNGLIAEGNYFKALKRKFALAKWDNDYKTMNKLSPILNSDLGRLYHIVGDIDTLVRLLDQPSVPIDTIKFEIDQFIARLSNIYTLKDYLSHEKEIIASIHHILKLPVEKLQPALEELRDALDKYLQKNTSAMSGETLTGGMYLSPDIYTNFLNVPGSPGFRQLPENLGRNFRNLSHSYSNPAPPFGIDPTTGTLKQPDYTKALTYRILADDLNEYAGKPPDQGHLNAVKYQQERALNEGQNEWMTKIEPEVLRVMRQFGWIGVPDGRRKAVEHFGLTVPATRMRYKDIMTDPEKYRGIKK
jgi:hypothetical protein